MFVSLAKLGTPKISQQSFCKQPTMKIIVLLFLKLVVLSFYFTISFSLEARGHNLSGHSHTETPSSMSSVSEMDELMNALELGDRVSFFSLNL